MQFEPVLACHLQQFVRVGNGYGTVTWWPRTFLAEVCCARR